jgi:hypothetical protein
VHRGGHLNQALEQVPGLRRRRAPDLLPYFVRLEEPAAVEEVDPFAEEAPPLFRSKIRMEISALAGQS